MSLIHPLTGNNFRLYYKGKHYYMPEPRDRDSQEQCFRKIKNKRMSEDNTDLCKQKESIVAIFTSAKREFRPKALNETKKEKKRRGLNNVKDYN